MSDSVFSPPDPGVVSKSEKHFRSQHDTMMSAQAFIALRAKLFVRAFAIISTGAFLERCLHMY